MKSSYKVYINVVLKEEDVKKEEILLEILRIIKKLEREVKRLDNEIRRIWQEIDEIKQKIY